jgi:hypothetical protein
MDASLLFVYVFVSPHRSPIVDLAREYKTAFIVEAIGCVLWACHAPAAYEVVAVQVAAEDAAAMSDIRCSGLRTLVSAHAIKEHMRTHRNAKEYDKTVPWPYATNEAVVAPSVTVSSIGLRQISDALGQEGRDRPRP